MAFALTVKVDPKLRINGPMSPGKVIVAETEEDLTMYIASPFDPKHEKVRELFNVEKDTVLGGLDLVNSSDNRDELVFRGKSMDFGNVPRTILERFLAQALTEIQKVLPNITAVSIDPDLQKYIDERWDPYMQTTLLSTDSE